GGHVVRHHAVPVAHQAVAVGADDLEAVPAARQQLRGDGHGDLRDQHPVDHPGADARSAHHRLARDGVLGRGAHPAAVGEEVVRAVGENLVLRLHALEHVARAGAVAAAPREHTQPEEEEGNPHRMSSCTVLTSLAPSWERSALASLPSAPGSRATLIQKPSFTALRKFSCSKAAWYGWGSRIRVSRPKKMLSEARRAVVSKGMGMNEGGG